MIRVGLTGGLGCGKSFVGRLLQELGCYLVRADDLGHQVLSPGGEAYGAVIELFGTGVLNGAGEIDRKLLAAQVFGDSERLALLNGLVHPAVFRLEERFFEEVQAQDPNAIAVVEAAILIESGNYRNFDKLLVVACTEEQQITRAVLRDGCTPDEVKARLRRQMPTEEKRKYADYVIDTSGAQQDTIRRVEQTYKSLKELAATKKV